MNFSQNKNNKIIYKDTEPSPWKNSNGTFSFTKLFVNLYLFTAILVSQIFLVRDLFNNIPLNELHIAIIGIMILFSIISKEFSRKMISRINNFKVGQEGVEISFGEVTPDSSQEELEIDLKESCTIHSHNKDQGHQEE